MNNGNNGMEVVVQAGGGVMPGSSAAAFMPVMDMTMALHRREAMVQFVKQILVEGEDYGEIPGVKKKVLMKPGAEKLSSFFGMEPSFEQVEEIADWTGVKHSGEMFYYIRYRCSLYRDGRRVGSGEGSCNTWESKYRYRWVAEEQVPLGFDKDKLQQQDGTRRFTEFDFAIEKAETSGKYGKPVEHWQMFRDAIDNGTAVRGEKEMKNGKKGITFTIAVGARMFRVPNPDIADQVNTVQKMAQKRAFIAAILIGTGASQFFTQDLDDNPPDTSGIDTGGHPVGTQAAANAVRDRKLADAERFRHSVVNAKAGDPNTCTVEVPVTPAPRVPDAPPEVIALWDQMTDFNSSCTVFSALKDDLGEITGNDEDYYRILRGAGMEHANDLKGKKRGEVKAVVLALWNRIVELRRHVEPPTDEAAIADDSDIPEIMGGTYQAQPVDSEERKARTRARVAGQ